MKDTYKVNRVCGNCGFSNEVEIPKGTYATESVICDNCGCSTIVPLHQRRLEGSP